MSDALSTPHPSPHPGDLSKFGRADTSSPAPATTMAQSQQNQSQTHHTAQQTFLNPALPPGYSYTSLPYYTGMPGLPNTFQYGPAVFPVRALLLLLLRGVRLFVRSFSVALHRLQHTKLKALYSQLDLASYCRS